jgi:cytochrome c556
MAAGLAVLVGATSVAVSAQAKTEEDFHKLMQGVGAANGAMRKAADATATAAEAAKLETLFKDSAQFWTAQKNTEAAEWSTAAAGHAAAIVTAAKAGKMEDAAAHQKELGGTCQTCHAKYREKTETGYAIKKG